MMRMEVAAEVSKRYLDSGLVGEEGFALLIGFARSEQRLLVLDLILSQEEPNSEAVAELRVHLPAPLEVVGCLFVTEDPSAVVNCPIQLPLTASITPNDLGDPEALVGILPNAELSSLTKMRQDTLSLSVRTRHELWLDEQNENAAEEFQRLRDSVGSKTRVFQCQPAGHLLRDESGGGDETSLSAHLSGGEKKTTAQTDFLTTCVEWKAWNRSSGEDLVKEVENCVPLIHQRPLGRRVKQRRVELWGLALAGAEMRLSQVGALLKEALLREVDALELAYLTGEKEERRKSSIYAPPSLPYFVRWQEPSNPSTEARRQLHQLFALAQDRPAFQPGCRFSFTAPPYPLNPHTALKASGVKGTLSIVSGRYHYRHYMQDGFDDNKWGCAYRAFQTVWSWLLLQGYVQAPTPSHREIQEALVDVGDRAPKFVGSREWIGSLELSFVLSHLAGLDARIMRVESGAELGERARELSHYFQSGGSPVMIGGGVLAHTIAGVDFNEESGDVKFLVLDPHYTGHDDIGVITAKGWVGWKGLNFWSKESFYNLLLPILPKTI